jgi:hypothetical protein
MDSSLITVSSFASINGVDYVPLTYVRDFVPTALPTGTGTITSDVLSSFQETLDIMSKIDFSTLSNDKNIEWNVCLSKSCRRLSEEYSLLQKHYQSLKSSAVDSTNTSQRKAFADDVIPLIKKRIHNIVLMLPFPSMIEVTTTNGKSLSSFGLTSTCPLSRMVFDQFVFKPQGSSASDPISPDDKSSRTPPRHQYDSPEIREELWVTHGIGTFTIRELGRTRNTVTNICRDVLRKLL